MRRFDLIKTKEKEKEKKRGEEKEDDTDDEEENWNKTLSAWFIGIKLKVSNCKLQLQKGEKIKSIELKWRREKKKKLDTNCVQNNCAVLKWLRLKSESINYSALPRKRAQVNARALVRPYIEIQLCIRPLSRFSYKSINQCIV